MYPFIKLITTVIKARYRSKLKLEDESVLQLRAGFMDVDLFGELNNARYFSYMELGRWDYSQRVGFINLMRKQGWGVAVGDASIRYRRRIPLLHKFTMTSKIICHDGRWMYFLQETHRKGLICSSALMKVCVTSKQGLVPAPEVLAAIGNDDSFAVIPDWVLAWIEAESQRPWPSSSPLTS